MARPSKYETHVAPRFEEIKDWVRNGATDKDIWERLGISEDSFYEYKKKFSEFSESLKETKDIVDSQVESALLKNALNGSITAQIFWLKNRRPDKWREKPSTVHDDSKEREKDEYSAESLRKALVQRKIEGVDDDKV